MAGVTYDTLAEAETDRGQQRSLLTALNGWDRALRRDACGAWAIREDGRVDRDARATPFHWFQAEPLRREFDQTLGVQQVPRYPYSPHPCRGKFRP
jgi:hypothetical protein